MAKRIIPTTREQTRLLKTLAEWNVPFVQPCDARRSPQLVGLTIRAQTVDRAERLGLIAVQNNIPHSTTFIITPAGRTALEEAKGNGE